MKCVIIFSVVYHMNIPALLLVGKVMLLLLGRVFNKLVIAYAP